ncbi:MAG: 4Fe-4S dicluster domain-containing protein [Infirmifilum sp.]
MAGGYGVLVNIDKCIGCRACEVACKQWNQLKPTKTVLTPTLTEPSYLTADDWKVVRFVWTNGGNGLPPFVPLPYNCLHCLDPPCARTCPTGAIRVSSTGAVVIDASRCIGCGQCSTACPYGIPQRGADGKYYKCTFCNDRIQSGLAPACVSACPTGALEFGTYENIVAKARNLRSQGKVVYGLDLSPFNGGGTRWIFAASKEKVAAVETFPKSSDVPEAIIRELLKPLIAYGTGLATIVLLLAGFVSSRTSKKSGDVEEKGGSQ